MEPEFEALGIMDIFKLADKELVNKILQIAKTIQVEQIEGGITRITIDLVNKR